MNDNTLLSEAYGGDWPDSPPPIWRQLESAANLHPDKLALACLHQPPDLYGIGNPTDDYLKWSYSQLKEATDFLRTGLRRSGIRAGMTIVTAFDNGAEFPLIFWAAHSLACPLVPVNPRQIRNVVEMRHMLSIMDATVVFVESAGVAAEFDALDYSSVRKPLKVLAGGKEQEGWVTIATLIELGRNMLYLDPYSLPAQTPDADLRVTVTVLFTSGTTSLPKGCTHTDVTLNAFMKNLGLGGSSPEDIFCSVLPNNHAMGYFYVLYFLCNGGTVVYPSASFEPSVMAQALRLHSCTHTCLVPTALQSLLDYLGKDGITTFPALKDVCLAGASITPHHIRQVIRDLGARGVSTGFGMTEGSPIWVAPTSDPETLIMGNDTISGTASPGTWVRICAPGSTEALPRGHPGEIHESGPGVIAGYIGPDLNSDSFWKDKGGRSWFKTGDRAVMHPDGRVSVVGRYKDMIIRGGENISPAAIENVLNQFPGVEAQVVAAPDPLAGEVPVAVIRRMPDGLHALVQLRDAVRTSMGIVYVPEDIVSLDALGLDEFPRTMSGKIQKAELRKLVAAYRENLNSDSNSNQKSTKEVVLHAWWKATGVQPDKLNQEAPTSNFADSIMIMRVRDSYRKELGVTLSLAEMSDAVNLKDQMAILQRKSTSQQQAAVYQALGLSGPPTLEELQAIIGPENNATAFRETISSTIAAKRFEYLDVESVIPTSDFTNVMVNSNIMKTWNFGIAVVAEQSTMQSLKTALTAAIMNNPIWASFYVHAEDGSPFHITMKPQQKLLSQVLIQCADSPLRTVVDLQNRALQYPCLGDSTKPGPLFHALLYNIPETKCAGFVFNVHHIVHDASSMRLMLEDLNQALMKPSQPLKPHVPFQLWADIYNSMRSSPRAMLDVKWHAERLSDIHLHRKALYPPARVPRLANIDCSDGLDYSFDIPDLVEFKRHHPHITGSVIFKAAMALVNVARTKHTHALFANLEAARSSMPFWPDTFRHINSTNGTSLADLDASDVSGPTMNGVINLIPVEKSEKVLAFLKRIQSEQTELTKHAHAPWRHIIKALNDLHPGQNAGEMLPDTMRAQFLSWVPGFLGEHEKIRVVRMAIRTAQGLVIVASLGGEKGTEYTVTLRWDVANYSAGEVKAFIKDLETAVRWLLEEYNWERPVGVCLGLWR